MVVEREGVPSLGSLIGLLCVASSPAAPSAWFVCGGLTVLSHIKGPAWFFALFFMNALLFFSAPPRCQPAEYPLSDQFKANANTTLYYDQWRAFQWYRTSHGAEPRTVRGLRNAGETEKRKRARAAE